MKYQYQITLERPNGLTRIWTQPSKAKTNKGLAAGSMRICNRLLREYPDHREIRVQAILYDGLMNIQVLERQEAN